MTPRFDRLMTIAADRPVRVGIGIVLLTLLTTFSDSLPWRASSIPDSAAPSSSAPRSRKSGETAAAVEPTLRQNASDVVLIVDSASFFTQEGTRAVRQVVQALRELPFVDEVFWLDDVPSINVFNFRDTLLPRSTASPRQFEAARRAALSSPLAAGQLISSDAETLLLLVRLDWLFVESDEQCTAGILQTAGQVAAGHPEVQMSFMLTGRVPNYLAYRKSTSENRVRYQIIGYGMVVVMAIVLFRGLGAVVIVVAAPLAGVYWTMSLLRAFDLADNPFNEIVLPVLISMVGFTDGVHLLVEVRRRRADGADRQTAVRESLARVGPACFLTSLTTAIGLGALSLAHHETVREFGWSCVAGVVMTFAAVVTVIPVLCATPLGRRMHIGHGRGLVDQSLGRIRVLVDAVLARPRTMTAIAIAVTVTCIAVSTLLRPDERVSNIFPAGSEAAEALAHLDEAMGGTEPGRVDISWSEDVASDSDEVLDVLRRADDVLRGEQLIGHPISLRNFVDALPGDPDGSDRMSVAELLPPQIRRSFIRPEQREASIDFRVRDLGIATYGPVFKRIETELLQIAAEHPGFDLFLGGRAVSRWRNLHQIVVDLALSLGSSAAIIFVVLTIAFRSLRLGLIAVVPNAFPLALTGTFLVVTGESLELASVCAFTVCLGIAVDDTIHFLSRYREERARSGEEQAIRSAFVATGTALVMTTVILVTGFSTVLASGLRDQRIFASMACLTIGAALLGDLLFLPPMLSCFQRGRRRSDSQTEADDGTVATD